LLLAGRQIHRVLHQGTGADLVSDHRAARAFWEGYSPYSAAGAHRAGLDELGPAGLAHPPTSAFLFLPLAKVQLPTAQAILAWTSLASLVVELVVAAAVLGWPLAVGVLLAGLVASTPFFMGLAALGQIAQLIGFAYFLSWWALRRKRPDLAGVSLGLVATLNLFPALMLLWLAVTRRWRALAAALGVFGAVAAVMTVRFGLGSWRVFLGAQKELASALLTSATNQSLHGVGQRLWASPACQVPGRVAPEALALSALVSLVLLVFLARRARQTDIGAARALDLSFASFSALFLLITPWVSSSYDAVLVLPAMLAAAALRPASGVLLWAGGAVLAALLISWRVDVRALTTLQLMLWRGDRAAHLPLHLLEVLTWLPAVLLLALVTTLARRWPWAELRS
jgi:alpha-1,2-mannosyltransferase